jgi:hypothetical protein
MQALKSLVNKRHGGPLNKFFNFLAHNNYHPVGYTLLCSYLHYTIISFILLSHKLFTHPLHIIFSILFFYLYHNISLRIFYLHVEMRKIYTDFALRVTHGTKRKQKMMNHFEKGKTNIKMALCEKYVSGMELLAVRPCN